MAGSFWQVLLCLIAGIVLIVLLTSKYRIPPFFALLLASLLVGLGVGLSMQDVIIAMKDGFGNIMKSLGIIIVLGTTLGVLLEHTGSTHTMANFILHKVGQKRAPLAMSLTGFIVGLPIFCDSGYIVLNGLNKSLSRRTGIPITIMAVSMATGLYSVHCLIPPHPGATAAAGTLGVDLGKLILMGSLVAIPAMLAGYIWARYTGSKEPVFTENEMESEPIITKQNSVLMSFLPIAVPIVLIAVKSFLSLETAKATMIPVQLFNAIGDPMMALIIGIALALFTIRQWKKETLSSLLGEAVDKGGSILVIIGAGGAFGGVLAATKLGSYFGGINMNGLGILFPFLITVVLKTAQGSSTVAIITAASIVQPLLPLLGLGTEKDKLLCVLAMGAGSMMISHANDAYFWVIAKFSGLPMRSMLKVYSIATLLMGLVSLLMVYLLSFIL